MATVIMANIVANVANLMSEATALHMGKLATSARVLIISKLFVVPRLQPRRHRALTEARSHTRTDIVPRGATAAKAKEVATVNNRRRRSQRSRRSRKHMSYFAYACKTKGQNGISHLISALCINCLSSIPEYSRLNHLDEYLV